MDSYKIFITNFIVGIAVPIVTDKSGNEIGYRPLEVSDAELQRNLDEIESAPNDKVRLKLFKPLQEIFQRIQLANDECDFGMGLEFGMSLFAHGSHYFHKMILKVLPMAYELLNRFLLLLLLSDYWAYYIYYYPRNLYGDIIKAHLADRRKTICDRQDIEPASKSEIGPMIGTYHVVECTTKVKKPYSSDPNTIENETYPDEGPSYMQKLKAKGQIRESTSSK